MPDHDLDRPEYFSLSDLTAYAQATLQLVGDERPGNPYADDAVAKPVARRIAELSERNFLVAGLTARTHGLHDREAVAPDDLSFSPVRWMRRYASTWSGCRWWPVYPPRPYSRHWPSPKHRVFLRGCGARP